MQLLTLMSNVSLTHLQKSYMLRKAQLVKGLKIQCILKNTRNYTESKDFRSALVALRLAGALLGVEGHVSGSKS